MTVADYSLMKQTVTLEVYSGSGNYGQKMVGSAVSYSARVVYKQQLVKGANGEDVTASGAVWLKSNIAVEPEDIITLPDGSTPNILAVERPAGSAGTIHHTKVFFQ